MSITSIEGVRIIGKSHNLIKYVPVAECALCSILAAALMNLCDSRHT